MSEARSEVFFSPGGHVAQQILLRLGEAAHTLDICVFTITDDRIADEILRAHQRGVRVRIITDDVKLLDPGSDVGWLHRDGVALVTDHAAAHMHHKFAVIDGAVALAGSYNWTSAADRENHEDLLVLRDLELVAAFVRQFERLWQRLGPPRD